MEVWLQVRNTKTSCLGSELRFLGFRFGVWQATRDSTPGFPWFWSHLGLMLPSQILQCNPFTVILQGRHNEPLVISTLRSNLSLLGLFFQWGHTCDLAPRVNARGLSTALLRESGRAVSSSSEWLPFGNMLRSWLLFPVVLRGANSFQIQVNTR